MNSSLAPLRFPEFRRHIIARFLYVTALRMVGTVVAYALFQYTKSSFAIGLVGLSEFIPVVSLALYAGHRIDLSDKRKLMLNGMLLYALCVAALLYCTNPDFTLQKHVIPIEWYFYFIIFCTGLIRAFVGPTSSAMLAQLVPKTQLPFAANISSSTFLTASIIGHATAGFCIAGFGIHYSFYLVLGLVLAAAFIFSGIAPKPPAAIARGNAWESVKEGLAYLRGNSILLGAITLDLFAVLFGGAIALLPEVATNLLKVGPIGFGWLNASMDIGSMMIIISLTLFPLRKKQGKILFFAVAGFGICIIIFGLSKFYWLSFLILMIAGMLDGISVIIRGTILQISTPDHMRGRISSVNSIFINSSNELGQFESGFTARIMGTVPAILFGGCMTLLVVAFTWWRAPSLRKMEY